jgi:translation elongation factor EF-1beta
LVELGGTTAPTLTVDEKSLVLEKLEARIAEIIPEHYCDGMKPDGDGVFGLMAVVCMSRMRK